MDLWRIGRAGELFAANPKADRGTILSAVQGEGEVARDGILDANALMVQEHTDLKIEACTKCENPGEFARTKNGAANGVVIATGEECELLVGDKIGVTEWHERFVMWFKDPARNMGLGNVGAPVVFTDQDGNQARYDKAMHTGLVALKPNADNVLYLGNVFDGLPE